MCGIAGFTRFHTPTGDTTTLINMGNAIAHRGPDAHGEYLDDNIGLSHRRLSILDLSEAGNQPMHSHDKQVVIAFNGEIYNFQTLRESLKAQGYPFSTTTDTEVILALYHYEGKDFIHKLNGMFALALWDKNTETLILARDRIGKKPLYYFQDDTRFIFGSEIKAIFAAPDIPRNIRTDAVYDFFAYQYIPDPKTIFQDIQKLEPGHYLVINKGGINKHQYWQVSFAETSTDNEETIKKQLLDLTEQCTKTRMVSDVPLGAFLSGGVDSSGLVALMAKNSERPVTTCSIGFDDEELNETEFAQVVANQYKTDHHEFTVHQNVNDTLEHIVSFFDEPFADPSLVPTYFVSELAKQQVTVAMAGDGGDEVFAGYEKYTTDHIENQLRDKFPSWLRNNIFPVLANLAGYINATPFRRAKTLLTSLSVEPAMGFYMSNSMITDHLWDSIASDSTKQALNGYHPSKITLDAYNNADGPDHLAKILHTDMQTYLPGGILVKVDRMSMANSLEVRAPILDYKLMEYAATIPSSMKFKNGEKKYILKEIFKPFLPSDILYRKKMGFSVPLAQWLRTELKDTAEERLLNRSKGLNNYFKPEAIKQLWQQHQSGNYDHSTPLWSMLMFQMWWDRYMVQEQS